jgi:hypothetical protein
VDRDNRQSTIADNDGEIADANRHRCPYPSWQADGDRGAAGVLARGGKVGAGSGPVARVVERSEAVKVVQVPIWALVLGILMPMYAAGMVAYNRGFRDASTECRAEVKRAIDMTINECALSVRENIDKLLREVKP